MEAHEIIIGHKMPQMIGFFIYLQESLSKFKSADIREWFKEFTTDPYNTVYQKNIDFKTE